MNKPEMLLKWADERSARPISRADAAATIVGNRRANPSLRISVRRMSGDTYIASEFLGVSCCIYRNV